MEVEANNTTLSEKIEEDIYERVLRIINGEEVNESKQD